MTEIERANAEINYRKANESAAWWQTSASSGTDRYSLARHNAEVFRQNNGQYPTNPTRYLY